MVFQKGLHYNPQLKIVGTLTQLDCGPMSFHSIHSHCSRLMIDTLAVDYCSFHLRMNKYFIDMTTWLLVETSQLTNLGHFNTVLY